MNGTQLLALLSPLANTKSHYEYSAITIDKNNAFFG